MRRYRCLIFVFLALCSNAFAHTNPLFNGKWKYNEYISGDKKPYSVFDISLSEDDDGNIQGAYCFVTQYGNRIDCSPDGELNLHGHALGSSREASVIFYSFFGAKNGIVKLSLAEDNSLTWNIVTHPQGDGYYGPNRIIFRKAASQTATHVDERLVVVNKAYLYNEPSALGRSTAYVIKGDYVQPVSISPDLRFWKVKFVAKSGRDIEKWIDCQDIDFCAK